MAANNPDQEEIIEINGVKYKIHRTIKTTLKPEIIEFFRKNNIPFEAFKEFSFFEDKSCEEDTTNYVPIDKELHDKLYQISKITGIPVKEMVNNELGGLLSDHMRENPIVFLDSYLGIKNIKDPISMVKALKPIIDIPDDYMKEIENTDPMFYINRYNPYKYK